MMMIVMIIFFPPKKKEERRKCIIKVKCIDNKILFVTSFFMSYTRCFQLCIIVWSVNGTCWWCNVLLFLEWLDSVFIYLFNEKLVILIFFLLKFTGIFGAYCNIVWFRGCTSVYFFGFSLVVMLDFVKFWIEMLNEFIQNSS